MKKDWESKLNLYFAENLRLDREVNIIFGIILLELLHIGRRNKKRTIEIKLTQSTV